MTTPTQRLAVHQAAERRAVWRDQGHKVTVPQRKPYGLVTAKRPAVAKGKTFGQLFGGIPTKTIGQLLRPKYGKQVNAVKDIAVVGLAFAGLFVGLWISTAL